MTAGGGNKLPFGNLAGVAFDRSGADPKPCADPGFFAFRVHAKGRKLGRPKGSLGFSRLDGKEDDIRRFLHRQAHGRLPYDPLQLHERKILEERFQFWLPRFTTYFFHHIDHPTILNLRSELLRQSRGLTDYLLIPSGSASGSRI